MPLDDPIVALLGAIAAIDLAQFTLTIQHRGRIARVEADYEHKLEQLAMQTVERPDPPE